MVLSPTLPRPAPKCSNASSFFSGSSATLEPLCNFLWLRFPHVTLSSAESLPLCFAWPLVSTEGSSSYWIGIRLRFLFSSCTLALGGF